MLDRARLVAPCIEAVDHRRRRDDRAPQRVRELPSQLVLPAHGQKALLGQPHLSDEPIESRPGELSVGAGEIRVAAHALDELGVRQRELELQRMVFDRRLSDEPVERTPVEPVGEGLLGRELSAALGRDHPDLVLELALERVDRDVGVADACDGAAPVTLENAGHVPENAEAHDQHREQDLGQPALGAAS